MGGMLPRAEAIQGAIHAGCPHAEAYWGKAPQVHSKNTAISSVDYISLQMKCYFTCEIQAVCIMSSSTSLSSHSLRAVPRPTLVWKTLRLTYDPTLERNLMCVNMKAATRPFPTHQIGQNIRIAHTQMRYGKYNFRQLCCSNMFARCCSHLISSFRV